MVPVLVGTLSTVIVLAVVGVAPALAGPTVTVRIEGESATLLPLTSVTLSAPEPVSGCPANSANAAINLAVESVKGSWDHGDEEGSKGDFTETILGETHIFEQNETTWDVWIDDKWGGGICEDLLSEGDEVLMVADYDPKPYAPTRLPLIVSGAPTTVQARTQFTVQVDKIHTRADTYPEVGEGTPEPEAGVTVSGGGASGITGSNGIATLTLTSTGSVTLLATKSGDVPSASFTVCVHNGNDGNCGTPATGSGTSTGSGTTPGIITPSVSTAITAHISSLLDSHVYARGKAPRILAGTVTTAAALEEVELRLTRRGPKGRCSYFDGVTGRFHAMRCGAANGKYFKASNQKLFSYLLPETLAPGRYVLDAKGIGAGGHVSSLERGTSRIVFYVK
jgi:hypothetical protein